MTRLGPPPGKSITIQLLTGMLFLIGCIRTSADGVEGVETANGLGDVGENPIAPAIMLPTLHPSATPLTPVLPSVTPLPATARRLTSNGCCPYPIWSPDSRDVLFLHGGSIVEFPAIYKVSIETGEQSIFSSELGNFSDDFSYRAEPFGQSVRIHTFPRGEEFRITNGGYPIQFSPGNISIAWEVRSRGISQLDLRRSEIWSANLDGSSASARGSVLGGSFIGWAEDDVSLIFSGGISSVGNRGIWRLGPEDSQPVFLFEAARPRGMDLSPNGVWLAFYQAFNSDPEVNGLWILNTDGSGEQHFTFFGSYRWKSDDELLVLSVDPSTNQSTVLGVFPEDGRVQTYLEASQASLPIANNDWQISPDGRYLVFRSSEDQNLWLYPLSGQW